MTAELSPALLVALNAGAWLGIHLGSAWAVTQLSATRFRAESWPFRARRFERDGTVYERRLRIGRWKRWLPDGAALFAGGFRKRHLAARDGTYLERFVQETCRGELAHWLTLLAPPIFLLWNPVGAVVAMGVYALVASVPFILVQRYNRIRLERVIARRRRSRSTRGAGRTGAGRIVSSMGAAGQWAQDRDEMLVELQVK